MQIFGDIELWVASQSSMLLYPKCIQVKGTGIHRECPLAFCLIAAPKAAPFLDVAPPQESALLNDDDDGSDDARDRLLQIRRRT